MIKHKLFSHLFGYLILFLLLSNFLLFDLRHHFLITHNALAFISPKAGGQTFNYLQEVPQRLWLMLGGVEFLRHDFFSINLLLFFIFLIGMVIQIREKKFRSTYLSFLYLYFGYYFLSFIDKGPMLYFYQFPWFPVIFLVFCSLVTSRFKKVFGAIIVLLLILNINNAFSDIRAASQFIGKSPYSWLFLTKITDKIFSGNERTFGYFVYSPDAFAYEPKYAMLYNSKHSTENAFYFKKAAITYVIAEPPPPNNSSMKPDWWIQNAVKIAATPSATMHFDNGYEVRKYQLSKQQIAVPFDPSIDPGITFR